MESLNIKIKLFLLICLANTNLAISKNTINVNSVIIEDKAINYIKEIFMDGLSCESIINVRYPVIKHPDNVTKFMALNNSIHKVLADELAINLKDKTEFDYFCSYEVDYKTVYQKQNLLTINLNYKMHGIGAASVIVGDKYFNIDLEKPRLLKIDDLFLKKERKKLTEKIFKKFSEGKIQLPLHKNPSDDTLDACSDVTSSDINNELNRNPHFYFISNDGIVINFIQNSIAASFCGNVQVKLTFDNTALKSSSR